MNSLLKSYRYLFKRSSKEKIAILNIAYLYLKVSFIIRLLPLRRFLFKYFSSEIDHEIDMQPLQPHIHLINRVLQKLPGKLTCLKRSIIVHLYFKRYGLVIPLYLGVKTEGGFRAHAWFSNYNSHGFKKISIYDKQKEKKVDKAGCTEAEV